MPATAPPFAPRRASPRTRPLVTYIGRVAHEKNIGFLVHVFRRVLAQVPEALLVIAGEGPAREVLRAQVATLGLARARALRRLSGARQRAARLLRGRGCVRVCLAHRDPGPGAARSHGAGRAGGLDRRARHALDPRASKAVRWSCPRRWRRSPPRWCACWRDAGLREGLAARGRAYAHSWSSAAMARDSLRSTGKCAPRRIPPRAPARPARSHSAPRLRTATAVSWRGSELHFPHARPRVFGAGAWVQSGP